MVFHCRIPNRSYRFQIRWHSATKVVSCNYSIILYYPLTPLTRKHVSFICAELVICLLYASYHTCFLSNRTWQKSLTNMLSVVGCQVPRSKYWTLPCSWKSSLLWGTTIVIWRIFILQLDLLAEYPTRRFYIPKVALRPLPFQNLYLTCQTIHQCSVF